MKNVTLAIGALITLAVAYAASREQALAAPPEPQSNGVGSLDDIPMAIRGNPMVTVWETVSLDYSGEADFSAATQEVWIEWSRAGSEPTTEKLSVTFWPSAITYLGGDVVCVAGLEADGDTVIELWKLRDPLYVLDVRTGEGTIVGRGTSRRARVFESDEAGKSVVQNLMPMLDTGAAMLVQYWDSSDVYRVDTTTGQHVLVATNDPQSAATYVPALDAPHVVHWNGRHVDHGYCYVLGSAGQVKDITVLIDSNADSIIDVVNVYDLDEFVAEGFSDNLSYY